MERCAALRAKGIPYQRFGVDLEFRAQHFQAWKADLNSFDSKADARLYF